MTLALMNFNSLGRGMVPSCRHSIRMPDLLTRPKSTTDNLHFLTTLVLLFLAAVGSCFGRKGKVVELSNAKGRFFSPLFPNDFPRGINCTWLIKVPDGRFVRLKMKKLQLDDDCYYSALHVRDGKKSSSSLLKRFCGQMQEYSVFSSGRYLYVQFTSKNDDYHAPGFDAVYEAVKQSKSHCF